MASAFERLDCGEEELLQLLEDEARPVVVAVTVSGAAACADVEERLAEARRDLGDGFRLVLLEAVRHRGFLERNRVASAPALLGFENGRMVAQHVGSLHVGDFVHVLGRDQWGEALRGRGASAAPPAGA